MNKKIFGVLFFSIFISTLGVGIVIPLLPVYAHDMGASGIYIALIFGSFSLSRSFFLPYFGRASDIKGRKPFITSGLLIYALVSIAFIFSKDVNSIIGVRFIQGIGSAMILPIAQAYIGEITPPGKEGFVMGLFNISLYGGLSFGPIIGGLIMDMYNIQASFVCMGLLTLCGFFLSLYLLPSKKHESLFSRKKSPFTQRRLLKDKAIAGLFIFRFAYTTCIGIIWAFLPIMADTEFSLSSFDIGILVMLGVLISGILQTPMGFLADRIDRRKLVIFGGIITSLAVFSLEFAAGFKDMFISNIIYGLGGGISMPALMAISVVKGNKNNSMGSVMALLTMGHTLGMLFGSLLAGIIMDMFRLRFVFITGGFIMFAGVVLFYFYTKGKDID